MKNIVDFLKLPPRILGALSVASGLLLFLPNAIIEKLYMTSFRDKYGFAIGIVFVVSTSILVVFFIINYICLFNYLFISSQMSAKPYFIGSTGILPLW